MKLGCGRAIFEGERGVGGENEFGDTVQTIHANGDDSVSK